MRALWWWIDRWRKSTAFMDMTLEQQGAYRNLLDEAALRGGPLPNDERVLAKACGDAKAWRRVGKVVMARFDLRADGWHNATLETIIARSDEIRTARAESGRKGGLAKLANTIAKGVAKPVANTLATDPDPDPIVDPTDLHKELCVDNCSADETLAMRAGHLVERYQELFYLHRRGARYHSRIHLDFQKAQQLVKTWPDDARLEKLAVIILESDDEWIARTDRGFGVFAAKASWADDRLTTWEAENKVGS